MVFFAIPAWCIAHRMFRLSRWRTIFLPSMKKPAWGADFVCITAKQHPRHSIGIYQKGNYPPPHREWASHRENQYPLSIMGISIDRLLDYWIGWEIRCLISSSTWKPLIQWTCPWLIHRDKHSILVIQHDVKQPSISLTTFLSWRLLRVHSNWRVVLFLEPNSI